MHRRRIGKGVRHGITGGGDRFRQRLLRAVADLLEFGFHRTNLAFNRLLDRLRGVLHFFLQLAQLVKLDLAIDVGFDIVNVALHTPEQMPRRARHARQFFGPEHNECYDRDDDHLGEADIEHGGEP